jgi:hypothetical protein
MMEISTRGVRALLNGSYTRMCLMEHMIISPLNRQRKRRRRRKSRNKSLNR